MGGARVPGRALRTDATARVRISDAYIWTVTTLTLIGKPDCHLCAVAREIVDVVVAETAEDQVVVEEFSILDDPALYELWWEKIPGILIDGQLHAHWRVSADRLRVALNVADGTAVRS